MVQAINMHVRRKLRKQARHSPGTQADFVARLSADRMTEYLALHEAEPFQEGSLGMLLYERDVEALSRLVNSVPQFDQVPFSMIEQAPDRLLAMLPSEVYSVLLSSLAIDWVDAGAFIRLLEYLLKPEGVFWFSAYGPATAVRTRSLLSELDQYAHFNDFYDLQDIGDALLGSGLKNVVLESSVVNLEYTSSVVLLADAERVFGMNRHKDRRRTLTPPRVLGEFKKRVEARIRDEGKYSEQVEILFAHGRKASIPGIKGRIPVREG